MGLFANDESLVPVASSLKFTFDTDVDPRHLKELLDDYTKLTERVSRFINEPVLNQHPIVRYVLQAMDNDNPNYDELLVVGKALQKLAELLPEATALSKKVEAVNYIRSHPDFIAWAFGSISDNDISQLIGTNPEENHQV